MPLPGTNAANGYDPNTVWCVMQFVNGVRSVMMIHRTKGKAMDTMSEMTGKGMQGLWIEDRILHN